MDIKKILKKIIIGLVCLLIVTLIGLNVYQHQQIKKASLQRNSETPANSTSTSPMTSVKKDTIHEKEIKNPALSSKDKASAGGNDDDLNYQLDAAEEELDMVHNQLSAEQTKKAELKKAQLELQKKSMKDPSFKKYMRNNLDMQYGDLFKQLNVLLISKIN